MKLITTRNLTVLISLLTFIVYLITGNRDLSFTDCGELAGACSTLGICHPTGYPLFTLFGYFWSILPLGLTKIYQLNILAAIYTAISASILFNSLILMIEVINPKTDTNLPSKKGKSQKKNKSFEIDDNVLVIISFISALIYGFAQTIWQLGLSIEVYSLQAVMFNLVIFLMLKSILMSKENNKFYFLTALALGLSFSNHMTTILVVPFVLFLFFKMPNSKFDFSSKRFKLLLFLAIPFILGISLYLYLPIRSSSHPAFNWGWVHRSFDKFIYHISGKQFQVWMFTGSEVISKNFNTFVDLLIPNLTILGIVLGLLGGYTLMKYSKTLLTAVILLIVICLAYSLNYGINDIDSYFLLAFIGLIILVFFGILGLATFFPKYQKYLIATVILPVWLLIGNYAENNKSKDYLVPEYTRLMGDNLEKNAIIISNQWDYFCSAFWYKQLVEGYRKDVVLVEKELLRRTWYADQFKLWYPETAKMVDVEYRNFLGQLELFESGTNYDNSLIQKYYVDLINAIIDKNYGKRPIYITLDILMNESDRVIGAGYEKIPVGFAHRLEKSKEPFPVNVDNLNLEKFISSGKSSYYLDQAIHGTASLNIMNIGRYAFFTNQKEVSKKALELALRVDPTNENAKQILNQIR